MALALCVVCALPVGVGVDRRRTCPHRRDVGPWCTVGVNGAATVYGTMVLRGCVCVAIAVVAPTMVTPEDRGGLVDEGAMRWHSWVYVCSCGDRLLRPESWYSMATHPSDS